MQLQLVRPDEGYGYNIVVGQESSLAGAATTNCARQQRIVRCLPCACGTLVGQGSVQRVGQEKAKKLPPLGTTELCQPGM